jgi:hypothetical protein
MYLEIVSDSQTTWVALDQFSTQVAPHDSADSCDCDAENVNSSAPPKPPTNPKKVSKIELKPKKCRKEFWKTVVADLQLQVAGEVRVDEEPGASEGMRRLVSGEGGVGSARHAGGVPQRPAGAVGEGDGLQPHRRLHVVIRRRELPPNITTAHGLRKLLIMKPNLVAPGHHVQRLVQPRCTPSHNQKSLTPPKTTTSPNLSSTIGW